MNDPTDRSDRFELIARTEGEVLAELANGVLESGASLAVLQEPKPHLLMQRVREPVERRPFNLGEVVVTPAEVTLDGERGFAMYPGKAERAALSGAVLDAAVAGRHDCRDEILDSLVRAAERQESERAREWAESCHTAVEFDTMEDEL